MISHNEKMQFHELNFEEFEEAFESLKRNKAATFDALTSNIIIINAKNVDEKYPTLCFLNSTRNIY